jgi:hypothetical protein
MANKKSPFSREELEQRSDADLEAFAAFATNEKNGNYAGQGETVTNAEEEPLTLPAYNFGG